MEGYRARQRGPRTTSNTVSTKFRNEVNKEGTKRHRDSQRRTRANGVRDAGSSVRLALDEPAEGGRFRAVAVVKAVGWIRGRRG